jgi:O-methyltransferase
MSEEKINMINFDNTRTILNEPNICVDSTITSVIQLEYVLALLDLVLKQNIAGDVVEFGCYVGESAKQITRMLNIYQSNKLFYVYDSFEGLPKPKHYEYWHEGALKTNENILRNNFIDNQLELPIIYKSWFKDVPEDRLPNQVCFAFLDGDLYESIYDSLEKIYDKLSYGAIICFHDYDRSDCPGVKLAIDNFFTKADKIDRIQYKIVDQLGIYIHI